MWEQIYKAILWLWGTVTQQETNIYSTTHTGFISGCANVHSCAFVLYVNKNFPAGSLDMSVIKTLRVCERFDGQPLAGDGECHLNGFNMYMVRRPQWLLNSLLTFWDGQQHMTSMPKRRPDRPALPAIPITDISKQWEEANLTSWDDAHSYPPRFGGPG